MSNLRTGGYIEDHAAYSAKDQNKQEIVDIMRIVASKMDRPRTDEEIEEIHRKAVVEVTGKRPDKGSFIRANRG